MRRFGVGLFVGMVIGMTTVACSKNTKQLIKKAKNVLDM